MVRALALASAPGASACAQAAGRYQRGTVISRLPFSTASRIRSTTSAGSITSRLQGAREALAAAGTPPSRRSRGYTVCTDDPARRELDGDRARERELCVLRRRVRPDGHGACDGDDVDDVRAPAEPGQERERRPDRAEVVDVDHLLDPLRLCVEVAVARADAGVVHQQVDVRVALRARGPRLPRPRPGRRRRTPRARRRQTAGARARPRSVPRACSARTSSAPIPDDAPVTTATRTILQLAERARGALARPCRSTRRRAGCCLPFFSPSCSTRPSTRRPGRSCRPRSGLPVGERDAP